MGGFMSMGVSGRKMIEAMLAGVRNPSKLDGDLAFPLQTLLCSIIPLQIAGSSQKCQAMRTSAFPPIATD
jgi:hypothetical protein